MCVYMYVCTICMYVYVYDSNLKSRLDICISSQLVT